MKKNTTFIIALILGIFVIFGLGLYSGTQLVHYDYETNQSIAVVKSSGIGWTISQDQELAYKAIKKELNKFFLKMDHKKY